MDLYIEPIKQCRNQVSGKFLKGATPHNKGKSWDDYMPQKCRAKVLKNLNKGRGGWHKTGAGMNKKSVVAIKDNKLCGVFPSIQEAATALGVSASVVSNICNKKCRRRTLNGFMCFFENDNSWCSLIV